MAFLENIGKKMSEAGQKVRQKTGEISDTSRLNAQISEEERRISATYQEIGKLYMNLHHSDPEPELRELVQSVIRSEQTIRSCREQILRIRRVRTCSRCGAEIASGSAFCPQCGNPIPREEPVSDPNRNVCASCGTVMSPGMRFCTKCGRPLTPPVPVPAPDPVPERYAESAPVPDEATAESAPADPAPAEMPAGFAAPVMEAAPDADTAPSDPELSESSAANAPEEEPAAKDASESDADASPTCPSCGAPCEPGDAFCMNCGAKL